MTIDEFIRECNQLYPDLEKFDPASDEMIEKCEEEIGYKLPTSFRTFLRNFSNGIFLFDSEPIGGTSIDSPCGKIGNVREIIPEIPDQVQVLETSEMVDSKSLISFTTYDAGDVSNNHWVFICEDHIPFNNYRVGFITQNTKKIIKVLSNFEEWLTILFESNKANEEFPIPVFHALYPTFDERVKMLDK